MSVTAVLNDDLRFTNEALNSVKAFTVALSKLQGELKPIEKSAKNEYYESDYSPLSSVCRIVYPLLDKHGFSVTQVGSFMGDKFVIITTLSHRDGHSVVSMWPVGDDKLTPQQRGSASTYARRYSLMAIVGAAPDDDDGNATVGKDKKEEPKKEENPYVKKIPLIDQLFAMVKKKGLTDEQAKDAIKKATGKDSSKELNDKEIESVIKFLGMKK